jgi:hypothetical protein
MFSALGVMHYGAASVVRGNVLRKAFPFEKCLPPGGIFTSIALIIAKPPSGGRKLSFREAVLPLMYLVKEDGLQTTRRNALQNGDAKRGGPATRPAPGPSRLPMPAHATCCTSLADDGLQTATWPICASVTDQCQRLAATFMQRDLMSGPRSVQSARPLRSLNDQMYGPAVRRKRLSAMVGLILR